MTPFNVMSILSCAVHGTLLALTVIDSNGSHFDWRDQYTLDKEPPLDDTYNEMADQFIALVKAYPHCFRNLRIFRFYPSLSVHRDAELLEELLLGTLQNVTGLHCDDRCLREHLSTDVPPSVTSEFRTFNEFGFQNRDISALLEHIRGGLGGPRK